MITSPDKILFPADGISKGELAAYYQAVAPAMLPHLSARPVSMERFPAGIGEKGFFQKDVSRGFPAWLERIEVPKHKGTVHHPLINDLRAGTRAGSRQPARRATTSPSRSTAAPTSTRWPPGPTRSAPSWSAAIRNT